MYNLIGHSDKYSKTSWSLYPFWRDDPNDNVTDSESFKLKSKFLDNTNNAGTIDAKITASLKSLSNFWKTLEIPLINCEINLILTWSANYVIFERNKQLLQ